jgi:serine protease Do
MKATRLSRALMLSCALVVVTPMIAPTVLAPPAAAAALPSFADLVKATQPAVVTVRVDTHGAALAGMTGLPDMQDPALRDFMERFFGHMPNGRRAPQQKGPKAVSVGSGFIIDGSGLIVTNNHVVENADKITVVLAGGDELPGTLVGHDEKTDLAVIRVKAGHDLPTVPWGDSDKVQVGDWAVAIGNPFDLGGTVTAGIVSARGRDIHSGPYDDFIQVDAAINRGNSGGPLFDQDGHVIGVNTAIYSPSGGNVGVGFAIPANQAREVVAQLVKSGTVERGWLGVGIQPVTDEVAESLGISEAKGALVASVSKDSPAAEAGLKPGDVILRFGATQIGTLHDLTTAVARTAPGTEDRIVVWRGGAEKSLTVHTGRMPTDQVAAGTPQGGSGTGSPTALAGLGLSATPGDGGLVISDVDPGSDAAAKGVRPGDVIVAANQEPVRSVKALAGVIDGARAKHRKSVLLLVERDGNQRFIAVELAKV